MARKHYREAFKRSAVQLVLQQGLSPVTVARDLGVDPASVRYWVKQLRLREGLSPTGEGAVQAELRQLRQENARLRMEREILKKAAAFFARESP
jgi:transposase